jgi:prepilin-type N-terminal cleavage/methylation domain-containing protein
MLKGNKKISRYRKGFTLMELTISSMIGVVFAVMIAQTLVSATNLTNSTISTTSIESDHRLAIDILQRYLRGARALETCALQSGSPSGECLLLESGKAAFTKAGPSSISFYAYTCATQVTTQVPSCAQSGVGLVAPDLVLVSFAEKILNTPTGTSGYPLSIKVFKPNAGVRYASATAASYSVSGPPDSELLIGRFEENAFSFFGDDRSPLTSFTTGSLSSTDLERIAIVEIQLRSLIANSDQSRSPSIVRSSTVVGVASREYGEIL